MINEDYDKIRLITERYHTLSGKKQGLEESLQSLNNQTGEMIKRGQILEGSLELLNLAAEQSRTHIKATVERVMTRTIRGIMQSDDYQFEIVFEKKRNQIEARPVVSPPGGNVLDSKGGTILDIITTTLRLIIKELLDASGPVLVDEPAKNIAEAHQPNFIRMLKEFSRKTDTQIIMCSHEREYIREADTAIEVRHLNGKSCIV